MAAPYVDQWPAVGWRPARRAWQPTPFRVFDGERALDVVPVGGARSATTGYDGAVFVVSAWNPGGEPSTLARNLEHHRRMADDLWARGWNSLSVATHDPELRWAEQALLLIGVHHDDAMDLARQYRQPAFVEWSGRGATVLTASTGSAMSRTVPVTAIDRPPACPMRVGRGDPEAGAVCRNPGGPWGSGAIHISALWRTQRDLLLATVGCGVCRGAPAGGTRGAAEYVSGRAVASRYGPARDVTSTTDREKHPHGVR